MTADWHAASRPQQRHAKATRTPQPARGQLATDAPPQIEGPAEADETPRARGKRGGG